MLLLPSAAAASSSGVGASMSRCAAMAAGQGPSASRQVFVPRTCEV
jgi:hypothetical protein